MCGDQGHTKNNLDLRHTCIHVKKPVKTENIWTNNDNGGGDEDNNNDGDDDDDG
jgi:hypothetical protein